MTTRVNLPTSGRQGGYNAGCYGLEFPDGAKYDGRPGQAVAVEDHHAAQIAASGNGRLGVIHAGIATCIGTKAGRWCERCTRLWQAWSQECPKCGHPTVPA